MLRADDDDDGGGNAVEMAVRQHDAVVAGCSPSNDFRGYTPTLYDGGVDVVELPVVAGPPPPQQCTSGPKDPRQMPEGPEDDSVADTHSPATPPPTNAYAIAVCFFASLGGLFFGYDQGVTGGILVMTSFLRDFCEGVYDVDAAGGGPLADGTGSNGTDPAGSAYPVANGSEVVGGTPAPGAAIASCAATGLQPDAWVHFATLFSVTYYIGCVGGALLGQWVMDARGRRAAVFAASVLFCAGTLWVCLTPPGSNDAVLVGRVVAGLGVGMSSFSLPIYTAELAPKHLRGGLSGFMQFTVVAGLLAAGVVNYCVQHSENGWRTSMAVAMVPPVVLIVGIFCIPESPRWLYVHRRTDDAKAALRRLRGGVADGTTVAHELRAIADGVKKEGPGRVTYREVFANLKIRKRLSAAVGLQVFQQLSGINPVFTYGGMIFEDAVGSGVLALLVLQGVNFAATIPALHWVDTVGRRRLLLIGACGMSVGITACGVIFLAGCGGGTDNPECRGAAAPLMITTACVYIFFFATSWGPVCWIYPAEIFPLRHRAKAVSLSTMANWTTGAVMIGAPALFPYLGVHGVFFGFGMLCVLAGVFVYWCCPETKGVMLEDIAGVFEGRGEGGWGRVGDDDDDADGLWLDSDED